MALDKGLSRRGFNGRNVSRMRKQDFIDFLIFKDRNSPSRQTNSDEGLNLSLEDEVLSMFQELIMDDSFQPIIHIMGALHDLENIHVFGSPSQGGNIPDKFPERTPNEEDESIPNFTIQELIKNDCSIDCKCETCQKNNTIIKDNLKVKESIQNLETKITCVVCQSNVRNTIFIPCNHLATCISCAKNPLLGKKCPLCRKVFQSTSRIFS
jgi:hypothetical protein